MPLWWCGCCSLPSPSFRPLFVPRKILSLLCSFLSYMAAAHCMEYFVSFFSAFRHMESAYVWFILETFSKMLPCTLFGKWLDELTFLSKKTKRNLPLQPTICVLCTKWPSSFLFSCYFPRDACSRCSHAFQKNWVVRGGDPLGMVRPVGIKIWMSCGPLNCGWFP